MSKGSLSSAILITGSLLLVSIVFMKALHLKGSGESLFTSNWNIAETIFLTKSGRHAIYPKEHLPVIETDNRCELGKLTALTFLHWIKDHPEGVIALPTGHTPEQFIKYLEFYKNHWNDSDVQKDLHYHGIYGESFPDTHRLKFVQLDEFYPMDITHKNSFTSYVNNYYMKLLNIPPENFLGMNLCDMGILKEKGPEKVFPEEKVDIGLLGRHPTDEQERWQKQALEEAMEYCHNFEETIRQWGGIGFLLCGIGPDGTIAFNMQGSSFDSKTRLVQLNYASAAAGAGALGGIEYSHDKTAVTIGLDTMISHHDPVVIIMATGEAKASIVANAIEQPRHPDYPASVFHDKRGTRFYLTKGAASTLQARKEEDIRTKHWNELTQEEISDTVMDLALMKNKRILDLRKEDFYSYGRSRELIKKYSGDLHELLNMVRASLIAKIEKGLNLPKEASILHTSPHHDDIILSYHAPMRHLLKNNQNYFAYLTSGFNAVSNRYMLDTLSMLSHTSLDSYRKEIFDEPYSVVLQRYNEASKNNDTETMKKTESIILHRNLCKIFALKDLGELKRKNIWLTETYFPNLYPGEKDLREIQFLKGSMRESESERMLMMEGVPLHHIYHMRSKFYTGDYFNPLPTIETDAEPVLSLFNNINPNVITVAFDPEGTGPDSHYKVLQVVAQALRMADDQPSLNVWGYRNVWHRFKVSEANLMIPVSEEDIDRMSDAFVRCFSTQRTASFPSPYHEGPFFEMVEALQHKQYNELIALLGKDFFDKHPNPMIRDAKGFVFIKEMNPEEFLEHAGELRPGPT